MNHSSGIGSGSLVKIKDFKTERYELKFFKENFAKEKFRSLKIMERKKLQSLNSPLLPPKNFTGRKNFRKKKFQTRNY